MFQILCLLLGVRVLKKYGFLSNLIKEFKEANKPHLFMWMFFWLIETNILFYIASKSPNYLSIDYIIIYFIIAICTTALLNPSEKDVRKRMW